MESGRQHPDSDPRQEESATFQGSIPVELRQILHEQARAWTATDVYVGCSGNFTIERVLHDQHPDLRLHGNDVSIYSCALGAIQTGGSFPIRVRPQWLDDWGWLEEWDATPEDQAATLVLCTRMLEYFPKSNPYYDRLRAAHRDQWAALHAETKAKFVAKRVELATFTPGDVRAFMRAAPRDAAFASFPPFYRGGYEMMFSGVDDLLEWTAPAYETLDADNARELLDDAATFAHWVVITSTRIPDFDAHLRGYVRTTLRSAPTWVYGSTDNARVVVPRQKIQPVPIPHLEPDATIGAKLTLASLNEGQFAALRSLYLNPRISPATLAVALAAAVLADGILVGVFALRLPSQQYAWPWPGVAQPSAYLLSDFPVAGSRYPRLSKLIVMAALSREAIGLGERYCNHRLRSVVTTAFSNRPVSMKYRGVLELRSRKEQPANAAFRYELGYASDVPRWTLDEAFARWRQKYEEPA